MDLSQFTPAAVLARKLVAQREKYLADFNTLYLGDIQLRSTVQWQKRGKGSILTSSRIGVYHIPIKLYLLINNGISS